MDYGVQTIKSGRLGILTGTAVRMQAKVRVCVLRTWAEHKPCVWTHSTAKAAYAACGADMIIDRVSILFSPKLRL